MIKGKGAPRSRSAQPRRGRRGLDTLTLTGMGIGGIIGAGFFLGSGIVIRQTGPAVVLTYVLAGLILAQVMGAITSLAVHVPVETSYQEYVTRYLGRLAGFVLGWAVFISGVLAVGSEAVAMATYSRTWLPNVALGVFAVVYVSIVILLNLFGVANLGKAETLMSAVKSAVLVGFVVLAWLLLLHLLPAAPTAPVVRPTAAALFPHGWAAVLRAMLIVIFSYAGVTTVAMATGRAKDPVHTVPRAALYTTLGVVLLYTLSILGLVLLVPSRRLSPHASPFVTALQAFHLVPLADVFNGVILVASFSVMAGTFYATVWMLVSLGRWHGAPSIFRHPAGGRPWWALAATSAAVLATLLLAFILPRSVYTDLTAASSYFSFVNWLMILFAFSVWFRRERRPGEPISGLAFAAPAGPLLTAAAVVGLGAFSVTEPSFHLGFALFAATTVAIVVAWFLGARRHMAGTASPG